MSVTIAHVRVLDATDSGLVMQFTVGTQGASVIPRVGESIEIRSGTRLLAWRVEDVVHEYDANRGGDQSALPVRVIVRRLHR